MRFRCSSSAVIVLIISLQLIDLHDSSAGRKEEGRAAVIRKFYPLPSKKSNDVSVGFITSTIKVGPSHFSLLISSEPARSTRSHVTLARLFD